MHTGGPRCAAGGLARCLHARRTVWPGAAARRTASTTPAIALASRRLRARRPAQPECAGPEATCNARRLAHIAQAPGQPRPTFARRSREKCVSVAVCTYGAPAVKRAGYVVMRSSMRSCRKLLGSQGGRLNHARRSISARSAACAFMALAATARGHRGQPSCL